MFFDLMLVLIGLWEEVALEYKKLVSLVLEWPQLELYLYWEVLKVTRGMQIVTLELIVN